MYMTIRLPLVCFLIVGFCYWQYSQKKRLSIRSGSAFAAMMVVMIFNLLTTTVTEYTVNHRDIVDERFNYIWHILFITSITCVIGLLLLYQLLMIERSTGRHQRREKTALEIVVAVGVLTQVFLPIEYIDTPNGSYSLGPKAYSLYAVVVFSLAMLIWKTVRYRRELGREKSRLMMICTGIFIFVSGLQMCWPYLLLTDAAMAMIAVGLTVNTEDSFLYLHTRTQLFNELAGREVLAERLFDGKPFRVKLYVFMGDDAAVDETMVALDRRLKSEHSHVMCCMIAERTLLVLPTFHWMSDAELPAGLPAPKLASEGMRCKTETLEFQGDEDLETVCGTIWAMKNRFEAEDLQIDELTRLLRREPFISQLNGMMERGVPFSLLMIDLDNFKSINDTFGHHVGDLVLQGCADVFRGLVRTSDLICRMGGDEFAIALSGTLAQEDVRHIFDRMSDRMARMHILDDRRLVVEVSVGVKDFRPAAWPQSFEELYAAADGALYEIKKDQKHGIAFCD